MAEPDAFVALYERDAEAVLVFLTRRTLDVEVALDLTAVNCPGFGGDRG